MTTKLKRKKLESNSKDPALLFHAMYVMMAVDGTVSAEEAAVLRSIVACLPDFRKADMDTLLDQSKVLTKRYGGLLESIEAFGEMTKAPDLRYRAFLLAVEVAYASGGVNKAEEQLLSALGNILGLNDEVREGIVGVMSIKYAT